MKLSTLFSLTVKLLEGVQISPQRVVKITTVFFGLFAVVSAIKYLGSQKIIDIIMTCYKNLLLNLKRLIHDHNQTNDYFLRETSSPFFFFNVASIYIATGYAYMLDMS